jgi:hypothetical protein
MSHAIGLRSAKRQKHAITALSGAGTGFRLVLDNQNLTKKSKSLQPQKAVAYVGTAKKRQPLI